jgi:hypothetical protein
MLTSTYLPDQKSKIIIAVTFQILKHETTDQFLICTLSNSLQVGPNQIITKHARFYIMVALLNANGQDFIRNERPTRYRGGCVLERVSDVQFAKERKCTSYGGFWLGIIVDGSVYARPGESIILCTVIYWEGSFWEPPVFLSAHYGHNQCRRRKRI